MPEFRQLRSKGDRLFKLLPWGVTRMGDNVMDEHFHYTGYRHFEITREDKSMGHIRFGGGFYEGAPVEMKLDGIALSRLKRVR
ncbi:hypothetical protein HBA55_23180 [Pseudomaricurvus alkylphenolicus]|jgi:hypothetical protein|uniref:hypothetical protein n=1 Tax=Pseudomaricurvus alkylphenolicus TaxID=1306991 RepID=UPI00142021A7|nr:hypothetical protein [Pseudomaricurvus alkylphenolicus]NIB42530.1 hypothetical protein [Pseudomaricurvus alkylphenolicus]